MAVFVFVNENHTVLLLLVLYCLHCDAVAATCDGTLSMTAGDRFTIVERDCGDGWIQVRDGCGNVGYVPSSYVECQFSI